jgi:hypothetical protein
VEQSYVDRLYSEISELRIELEPDPTILGARYIQSVTSRCRNHLNRVALIRVQLNQKKRNLMVQIAGEETSLSIEKSSLLAGNDTVRRGSNIADREAIANTMLRQQINRISVLKLDLLDIDTVDKAVKMIHDELIRTSQEIKVQRSLLFSDRHSGAGYGDETPIDGSTPPSSSPQTSHEINENELDNLMKGTIPLVPKSKVEEEDPDLLAALASIEDGEFETEVKPAADKPPAQNSNSEPVVSDGVPQATTLEPAPSPVTEEDLAGFLEGDSPPKKAATKKPKGSGEAPPKVKLEDVDLDFNDILSNL